MSKLLFKHLSILFGFGALMYLLHNLSLRAFEILECESQFLAVHLFLFILTSAGILATLFLLKKRSSFVGIAFVGVSLLKMLMSVLFIYPVIKSDAVYVKIYVVQFMVIYFVYLTFEVVYIARLLNHTNSLGD